MLKFTSEQIQKIQGLNPLTDSKFNYDPKSWQNLNENCKCLISDFENIGISRQDVINAFKCYFNSDNDSEFIRPFLLSMVWGFGNAGYGTYRTKSYIENDENRNKIKLAIDYIGGNEVDRLKKSFFELMEIKGLGISYLTKVLYFATRARQERDYAIIFDMKVADSLVKLTAPKEIYEIINIGPSSKFCDYIKYNNLIHKLAEENKIEPENLEMYLFKQEF